MKKNYRKAFNALSKIGAPVLEGGDNGEDTFRISAEQNEHSTWADFYIEHDNNGRFLFGVNTIITEVLDKNGLYAEWINPGVLAVCEV